MARDMAGYSNEEIIAEVEEWRKGRCYGDLVIHFVNGKIPFIRPEKVKVKEDDGVDTASRKTRH